MRPARGWGWFDLRVVPSASASFGAAGADGLTRERGFWRGGNPPFLCGCGDDPQAAFQVISDGSEAV
jgi:hypothetical protein